MKPIDQINKIKKLLISGAITYSEAKTMSIKPIKEMEKSAEKIAKKFGKKAPKFSFNSLMR
mgnify:FL=1